MDDINSDTKLSDAVFNIIDAKGKIVRTDLTTDKDGRFQFLIYVQEIISSLKRKLQLAMI